MLGWVATLLPIAAAACSASPKHQAKTEQELHAEELSAGGHDAATHEYRCRDGSVLFVDFGHEGLSIEIRTAPGSSPLVLTAPSQGTDFVGAGTRATMKERELLLVGPGERQRLCTRTTIG
ncbi:hypothetical protein HJG53_12365 [Sphingomonas sp. ID1715]|uniref:hypothetical protein n=1 Tax=Sphingomonas sp. ID1715 TaxID=1656898 RepID=UPI001489DC3B|nr:hypothetical protein [Sphingomonas sp. ID1715]NNM77703.1 hypothetical protein [Sphingomonas sp. ID1715]